MRQMRQSALEVAVLALLPGDQVPLGRREVALARVGNLLPVVRRVLLRAVGEDLDDLADGIPGQQVPGILQLATAIEPVSFFSR